MPLTFLVSSPRVAPGLMTWPAWQAVAAADRVLASDDAAPAFRAVSAAGHRVDVLPGAGVDDLLTLAATESVVWLADDEEAETFPAVLADRIVAAEGGPQVEVLHASYDLPGARLLDLVTVMGRLREGCPWDREQSHGSLARYLLEEAYETLEAIETGDLEHLREELGDLLLQVVFHAAIAAEDPECGFDIDDVAGGIVEKLVHRHPHVFGDVDVAGAAEVEENWEALKRAEKQRSSVLEGIPQALPALALADKTLGRAERAGVAPELAREDLGSRLLAVVVEARAAGLDPEQELRVTVRRFADTVRATEQGPG